MWARQRSRARDEKAAPAADLRRRRLTCGGGREEGRRQQPPVTVSPHLVRGLHCQEGKKKMDPHHVQQQQYVDPYRTMVLSPQPDHLNALQYNQQQPTSQATPPPPQHHHASLASHFHLLHARLGNGAGWARTETIKGWGRGSEPGSFELRRQRLRFQRGVRLLMEERAPCDDGEMRWRFWIQRCAMEVLDPAMRDGGSGSGDSWWRCWVQRCAAETEARDGGAELMTRLADAIGKGTRNQHSDALVEDLTSQFARCQQLLNSISGTLSSKSITVEGQRKSLEETQQLLDQRKDLITKYRSSVEGLLKGDTTR
uniref:Mediator of RNA polymerase II transcription subunit 9 n=1 Tax=Leersia perrieri TaxID=77586 RepID=A0A0D9XEE0_9ORYZ